MSSVGCKCAKKALVAGLYPKPCWEFIGPLTGREKEWKREGKGGR